MSVVCLLPVRNGAEELGGYLRSVARFCEAVVALDDGSTDGTRSILDASPLVQLVLANPPRTTYRGWDDGENRSRLLVAAGELGPEWVVFLDADERVPADDARALRDFLATDALPGCAYAWQHYRMWGRSRYDPDFKWIYRLFSYQDGQRLADRRLHFDPVPDGLPRVRTTIRVQHFGAATDERWRVRLQKYAEADPDGEYPTEFGGLSEVPRTALPRWQRRPADTPVLSVWDSRGLDPAVAEAVDRLFQASEGAIWLVSGFRTREHQNLLWERALTRYGNARDAAAWVAPPGESLHELGHAVDLAGDLRLAARLVKQLGLPLHRTRPNEPWHFELVQP